MRLAITGATGLVGHFVVEEALAAGDAVLTLARTPPAPGRFSAPVERARFDLTEDPPPLAGCDALIHLGFSHLPGRYRGGEGDDPEGFRRANLDGTLRLFEAARRDGVERILFLSSRAVYGDYPPGTRLTEQLPPRPDTLYGAVKLQAEQALAKMHAPGLATASLRATGVYGPPGPGQRHKWADLFEEFRDGRNIAPRVASEVHGADLAVAIRLLLTAPPDLLGGRSFNVSDMLLDRRDLLAELAALTGITTPLPDRGNAACVSRMTCTRLRSLGWQPGGIDRLRASLPAMLPPMPPP
ncbi:NAD(P)-dependent oxidoreductase [Tropicimonas sp. IMCC6043]|uniref:NAD-dependent epimerase/dehydratase family protein n=1 Tax=Tropicimonas sp. IMCC6043 TaxID=2510645 RepID=UPI00101C3AB2|nr:NAD(P)-dependent oxidoreductase [Tropicimonas sp. IMCC6043]RYH11808.1 NAD(P)-dependent oxidoreductase [Tropicimonas sp. IMCC6043]